MHDVSSQTETSLLAPDASVKTTPQQTRFRCVNFKGIWIQIKIESTITATRTPLTTRSTSTRQNPTRCAATQNTWGTRERERRRDAVFAVSS